MNCVKCGCLIWFVFLLEASCSDCPAFPSNECLAAEIISLEKSLTKIITLKNIFNLPNPNKLYGFSQKDWKKLGTLLRLIPSGSPLKQHLIRIIRLVLQAIIMAVNNRHLIIDKDEAVDENDMLLENVMLSENHDKILSRLPKNDVDEYFKMFEPKKKENLCKFEKLIAPQNPSVLHKVETTIDVVGALAQIIFGKRTKPKVVEKVIIQNLSTTTEAPVHRKDPNYDEEDSEEEDKKFFELMYEDLGLSNLQNINSFSVDKIINISRLDNEEISTSENILTRKIEVSSSGAQQDHNANLTYKSIPDTQNKSSKNFSTDFRKSGEGVKDDVNNVEWDILEVTQSTTHKPINHTAKFINKTDRNKTHGNKTHGNETDENKTDINKTNGNKTDANKTDGNKTLGNKTDGNKTDLNKTDGNKTDLNKTDGNKTDGNKTLGNKTLGNKTDGNKRVENKTDGNKTDLNKTDINKKDGKKTDGNKTDGNKTDGNKTHGNKTLGNKTDGNKRVENKTDGNKTDLNKTDINKKDGKKTDGNKTGENKTDGNKTVGNKTYGNKKVENKTDGNKTDGKKSVGNKTDGNKTDGNKTDINKTNGNKTLGNKIDGDKRVVSEIPNIVPRKRESKRRGLQKIMKVSGATASNARKSMKITQNNFRIKTNNRRTMGEDSPTVVTLLSDMEYEDDYTDQDDGVGFRMFTDNNETSSEKGNISGNSDSRRANIESDNFIIKADDDNNDLPKRRVQKSDNAGNEERDKELLYKWFFTKFKQNDARRVLQQIEDKENLPVYDYNGTNIPYRPFRGGTDWIGTFCYQTQHYRVQASQSDAYFRHYMGQRTDD